jgi:hypothetical protein
MFEIRAAGGAAGVPHGHVLAAFAFDVVADDAGAEEASAGAATGSGDGFHRIVEDVRVAVAGSGGMDVVMVSGRLAALDRFALELVVRVRGGDGVWNLDENLSLAMRAEALLAGVLILDLEDVSVGTFDANSHGQPTFRTTEEKKL